MAIELTGLALIAAIVGGTKALVIVLIPVAAVTVVGHLLAILTSSRLK